MSKKKKWLPRQQSEKLGKKGHLVILSKKDKQRSDRSKGKRRREYMNDHGNTPVFLLITKLQKHSTFNFSKILYI